MNKLFPNGEVYKSEYIDIHQDREVPIVGFFVLTLCRKGVRCLDEMTQAERYAFIDAVCELRTGMRTVLGIEDVYFFQNEDSSHGFHLWIFPRHPWMEQFGRKIQSVRPIMEWATAHRTQPSDLQEVQDAVHRMREFMSSQKY